MTTLITPALLLRFVSIFGSAVSFYLPLAVLPAYADAAGAGAAVGLATGALLVATVAGEIVTPRIVSHIGYRWALAAGLTLLGAPALVLLGSPSIATIVAVSAVRGVGFAITTVAGGALTAALIPAQRRGEGLALVGLVSGVSSMLATPAGVWASGRWGAGVVFALTAAAPLAALVTLPGLPSRESERGAGHGIAGGLRDRGVRRPAIVFATCTAAVGVLVTYLPLAVGRQLPAWVVPAALFAQPAAATAARWVAGRLGDRHGQARLLVPGLLLSIAGMAAVAFTGSVVAVVAGSLVFGAGFGVLQNATLALMFARVPAAGFSAASAIWNGAYDLGMAVGAIGAGVIVSGLGFAPAALLSAAVMVPALVLSRREPDHRTSPEPDLSRRPVAA